MIRVKTSEIKTNALEYAALCKSTWSPIIQASAVGNKYWEELFVHFPEYQLVYKDDHGDWVGFANTIPLFYDQALDNLPDTGWDWLIAKGHADRTSGIKPNMLGGLQIGINPTYRSKGYSKFFLQKAKELQISKKFSHFILPIRPTMKHLHPAVEMEEYMYWTKGGKIYDPWIRTHIQHNAQIIKVCHTAMHVEGNIADWEKWAERPFTESGQYAIEGGLSLVNIDLVKDKGTYLEPNIWIYYQG